MPFVHVELIEGRSKEQINKMMEDITDAVTKNTGAPAEHVHVFVKELKKGEQEYAAGKEWV